MIFEIIFSIFKCSTKRVLDVKYFIIKCVIVTMTGSQTKKCSLKIDPKISRFEIDQIWASQIKVFKYLKEFEFIHVYDILKITK